MVDTQRGTWTDADLRELPSGLGERYELVEGELQTMPAAGGKRGLVVNNIAGEFYIYLKRTRAGVGVTSETGFYTRGDNRTVRAPDYAFIPQERVPASGLTEGYLSLVPALVVEVVSPTDRAGNVEAKTQEWLRFGVESVWVVFPSTERVFVYQRGEQSPTVYTAEHTITGGPALPDFSARVGAFFAP